MSKAKTVDLTSGPILKNLAELALPIMVSSMLGTAYSIMDMAWIGLLARRLWPVWESAVCMSGFHRGLQQCQGWADR